MLEDMAANEELDPSVAICLRERRAFLELPLAERRRRLAEQADQVVDLYERPSAMQERFEWQRGDIIGY